MSSLKGTHHYFQCFSFFYVFFSGIFYWKSVWNFLEFFHMNGIFSRESQHFHMDFNTNSPLFDNYQRFTFFVVFFSGISPWKWVYWFCEFFLRFRSFMFCDCSRIIDLVIRFGKIDFIMVIPPTFFYLYEILIYNI